jgi:hypothetical protein
VPTNESVLANFFNSLLTKKGGAPGAPGGDGVSAELDRLARKPSGMLNAAGASMSIDKEKENQTDQRTA